MNMKMIVTDLDGTLLDSKGRIPEKNSRSLIEAEAEGIEIVIATGRNYRNARELCAAAGLRPHIVSNNGAFIFTKEGIRVHARTIEEEIVRDASAWLDAREYLYFANTDTGSFVPHGAAERIIREFETSNDILPGISAETIDGLCSVIRNVSTAADLDTIARANPGTITAICADRAKLEMGKERFRAHSALTMTAGGNHLFEMNEPSASKGNAVEILASRLGIPLSAVMAIGDHHNDLSMFEKAGVSVAMSNASDDIKRRCSRQTLSNDECGVAHAVRSVLGK